MTNNHFTFSTF